MLLRILSQCLNIILGQDSIIHGQDIYLHQDHGWMDNISCLCHDNELDKEQQLLHHSGCSYIPVNQTKKTHEFDEHKDNCLHQNFLREQISSTEKRINSDEIYLCF